jgi:hypothetical protein
LTNTNITVPVELLAEAAKQNLTEFRVPINEPTGSQFYAPWTIKEEFKGTLWEEILSTLPGPVGEARIITLNPGACYQSHGDIDDRYHLTIQSEQAYLIDLENKYMHLLTRDTIWYDMDAGRLHTAANFGRLHRIQLVVRKLLNDVILTDAVQVTLTSEGLSKEDARYMFDSILSPWLNRANKLRIINDFAFGTNTIKFKLERKYISDLESQLIPEFKMELE